MWDVLGSIIHKKKKWKANRLGKKKKERSLCRKLPKILYMYTQNNFSKIFCRYKHYYSKIYGTKTSSKCWNRYCLPSKYQFWHSRIDKIAFVDVLESSIEVPAHRWSKNSVIRGIEEGKKIYFTLSTSLFFQGGTGQCMKDPYNPWYLPQGKWEYMSAKHLQLCKMLPKKLTPFLSHPE